MVQTTTQSFGAVQVTALIKSHLPLPRPQETDSGFWTEKMIVCKTSLKIKQGLITNGTHP